MKAMLTLEFYGWGEAQGLVRRPGIAGIVATEKNRARYDWPHVIDEATGVSVVPTVEDYRGASRSFQRGVKLRFVLESGHTYKVRSHVSWRGRETYRCRVTDDGEIERIKNADSGLTS